MFTAWLVGTATLTRVGHLIFPPYFQLSHSILSYLFQFTLFTLSCIPTPAQEAQGVASCGFGAAPSCLLLAPWSTDDAWV